MIVNPDATAVILAAGLGSRLRPLSYQVPKPLFPVLNQPLLGLIIFQLHTAGFRRIAVNTHHLAAEVKLYVESNSWPNLEIFLSYEPEILGTGGGLRNLAAFIGELPFLVINADILTDLDFAEIYRRYQPDALATMVLHDCPRFNNIWTRKDGNIGAFGATPTGPLPVAPPMAYTGVQVVSPRVLSLIPPKKFVSIIDTYRRAIADGDRVAATIQSGFYWHDIGTPQDYLEVHFDLWSQKIPRLNAFYPPITDPFLAQEVNLGCNSTMAGRVCLGPGAQVGEGVYLKDSVVWAGATIDPGVRLEGCIVGKNVRVRQSAQGGIFHNDHQLFWGTWFHTGIGS
jgi:mannose-1-phosphate guanylyltransferase